MSDRRKPEFLKRYFWDVNFFKLDQVKNKNFIIERLLEMGDEKSARWMKGFYSREDIKTIVKSSKKLSFKSANYWALIFDIPKEEILCLNKQYQNRLGRIWRY